MTDGAQDCCDVCGSTDLMLLGPMGKMIWIKCRRCGSVLIRNRGGK